MPSHFSTIGLPIGSEDEFLALAGRVADQCETVEVPGGRYLRWFSECGAELWLQVDCHNDLIGVNPHFSGRSLVRVALTGPVNRPNASDLDGAFHGWADPPDDNPESGCYPFVFDVLDFRRYDGLRFPVAVDARIAAFAHEVFVFGSEGEYTASQQGEIKFSSRSFIPSGLFKPDADVTATDPPEAYAMFTGHVLEAEKRTNELTGREFHWALVESLGGIFDVVIHPELIESEPRPGGVLSGSFWLSGRVVRPPR